MIYEYNTLHEMDCATIYAYINITMTITYFDRIKQYFSEHFACQKWSRSK